MNAQQLCNAPVAFQVGRRSVRFRRLSSIRLHAIRQADFLASAFGSMTEQLDALPPDTNLNDRVEKLEALRDAMPTGYAFIVAANDHAIQSKGSSVTFAILAEANADGLTVQDLAVMASDMTMGQLDAVLTFVMYSKRARQWTDADLRYIVRHMASTYSYTPDQVAALTDDQLFDLLPGLAESAAKDAGAKAKADAQTKVATEVNKAVPNG